MDALGFVVLMFVLCLLVVRGASSICAGFESSMTSLLGGWKPDSWPRGVQEEDEPVWGHDDGDAPTPEPSIVEVSVAGPVVPTSAVRSRVVTRSQGTLADVTRSH